MKYLNIILAILLSILVFNCSDSSTEPDVSPPPKVTNFTYGVPTGDMLITLTWDKSPASDFAYFILYRKEEGKPYIVLDTLTSTSYTDTVDSYDKFYSYKIVAVDKAGNVSEPNEDARDLQASNIAPPKVPDSLKVYAINRVYEKKITITWEETSVDVKEFKLIKTLKDSLTGKVDTLSVDGKLRSYIDTNVIEGNYYLYQIYAVDFGGKKSGLSEQDGDRILKTPELIYPIKQQKVSDVNVDFIFSSVEGAKYYELVLSQAKDILDTVFTPSNSGVNEKITVDMSALKIEANMPIEWKVLVYSKDLNIINTLSATESFYFKK